MAKVDLNTLRNWFKNGLKPSQQHFWNWMDSYWHKDQTIPMQQINGLGNALGNKAEASQLANHSNDPDAHGLLNYIKRNDFLDVNGKIKTEKLQALALCDTIKASETTLADFVQNQSNYEFQKNDFIAIPNAGKFDLYLFVGDNKMVVDDYLPTGISNVSAVQIEGLTSYISDYIIGNMVLNRSGNSLHLGLERTISDGNGNSSSFTQTFDIIDLDFMQLDLPINTNGYSLPNTLRNNGADLIYQDENGIDKPVVTDIVGAYNGMSAQEMTTVRQLLNPNYTNQVPQIQASYQIVHISNTIVTVRLHGLNMDFGGAYRLYLKGDNGQEVDANNSTSLSATEMDAEFSLPNIDQEWQVMMTLSGGVQVLSNAIIITESNPTNSVANTWQSVVRGGAALPPTSNVNNNVVQLSTDTSIAPYARDGNLAAALSDKFLFGGENWEVKAQLSFQRHGSRSHYLRESSAGDIIGITSQGTISLSDLTEIGFAVKSYSFYANDQIAISGNNVEGKSTGLVWSYYSDTITLNLVKCGNRLHTRLHLTGNGRADLNLFKTSTIDTTKDYALFALKANDAGQSATTYNFQIKKF